MPATSRPALLRPALLRNVAIIAHVDHGKTTLIDVLLRTSGAFRTGQQVAERAMDSNALERERGITILAKVTSLDWRDARINLVDTPGHADFGGEVERILNMVDGAILLVDAAEGPMPQTKFVLSKALAIGLRPIVVINKIDKPDARPDFVLDAIFDLFAALDASDEQLDFPVLYGSAKHSWMADNPDARTDSVGPLLDLVLHHLPAPAVEAGPFRMLATTLEADPFLGRVLTGRIRSGAVSTGDSVKALSRAGDSVETFRVSKVLAFRGLERQPIETGEAGDIIALAGMGEATVADTLCDPTITEPIAAQPIDPPTLAMTFRINDGPLAGQEGDKVQSRVIRERLEREFGIDLIATAPSVIYRVNLTDGSMVELHNPADMPEAQRIEKIEEPWIEATILVPDEHLGAVLKLCEDRRGRQKTLSYAGARAMLVYELPLNEVVFDFYDRLKSVSRGYASYDYHIIGYEQGALVKMAVLVNAEPVDALSVIVHRGRAEARGRAMVEKLKDLIPRHMFKIPIQAAIGGKVIARETISALRKDVTAKCYGGDITRKRKLLEKQKAGKKKMRSFGRVDIPQEAFIAALKLEEN